MLIQDYSPLFYNVKVTVKLEGGRGDQERLHINLFKKKRIENIIIIVCAECQ